MLHALGHRLYHENDELIQLFLVKQVSDTIQLAVHKIVHILHEGRLKLSQILFNVFHPLIPHHFCQVILSRLSRLSFSLLLLGRKDDLDFSDALLLDYSIKPLLKLRLTVLQKCWLKLHQSEVEVLNLLVLGLVQNVLLYFSQKLVEL